jgi:uncharacterized protein
VKGGSKEYVKRILADFNGTVRLRWPIHQVRRVRAGVEVVSQGSESELFDHVVVATHADQALAMLEDAATQEQSLLGAFKYTHNRAVLHSDIRLMPKRRRVWSSWNYIGNRDDGADAQLCVSYWMNKLQNLKTRTDLFVTLNPNSEIAEDNIHAAFDYTHPLFDNGALAAQKALWEIQGAGGVWFCGAHFGSGFHEDGLQSGLAVAEAIGGVKRPWQVKGESSRIFLPEPMMAAQ